MRSRVLRVGKLVKLFAVNGYKRAAVVVRAPESAYALDLYSEIGNIEVISCWSNVHFHRLAEAVVGDIHITCIRIFSFVARKVKLAVGKLYFLFDVGKSYVYAVAEEYAVNEQLASAAEIHVHTAVARFV